MKPYTAVYAKSKLGWKFVGDDHPSTYQWARQFGFKTGTVRFDHMPSVAEIRAVEPRT